MPADFGVDAAVAIVRHASLKLNQLTGDVRDDEDGSETCCSDTCAKRLWKTLNVLSLVADIVDFAFDIVFVVQLVGKRHHGWAALLAIMSVSSLYYGQIYGRALVRFGPEDDPTQRYGFFIMAELLIFCSEDAATILIWSQTNDTFENDAITTGNIALTLASAVMCGLGFLWYDYKCILEFGFGTGMKIFVLVSLVALASVGIPIAAGIKLLLAEPAANSTFVDGPSTVGDGLNKLLLGFYIFGVVSMTMFGAPLRVSWRSNYKNEIKENAEANLSSCAAATVNALLFAIPSEAVAADTKAEA